MPPKRKQKDVAVATIDATTTRSLVLSPLSPCPHDSFQVESSLHAAEAGYVQPDTMQRAKAQASNINVSLKSGRSFQQPRGHRDNAPSPQQQQQPQYTFPAPLVLPDDDLSLDPKYPPQSVLAWTRLKERNPVTSDRRTIYVVAPPSFDTDVAFGRTWSTPVGTVSPPSAPSSSSFATRNKKLKVDGDGPVVADVHADMRGPVPIPGLSINDVVNYVRAFYHPLPVKLLTSPATFKFVPWSAEHVAILKDEKEKKRNSTSESKEKRTSHPMIGLRLMSSNTVVGVRTRAMSPPRGDFARQLNLDDLLDAAIESLPSDAYAFVMLVDQDLYEDDEDEFVCGRAYGGSRVAVVSTARYNPALDSRLDLDTQHEWPLSHCSSFVEGFQPSSSSPSLTSRPEKTRSRRRVGAVKYNGVSTALNNDSNLTQDSDSDPHFSHSPSPMYAAIHAAKTFQFSKHTAQPQPNFSSSFVDNDDRSVATTTAQSRSYLQSLWLSRVCRTVAHEIGHCFGIDHCVYYACTMQGSASIKEDHRQPPYLCPIDMAKVLRATGAAETDCLKSLLAFCEQFEHGVGATMMFVAYAAWLRTRLQQI